MSDSKALKEISSKFTEDTLTDIVRVVAGRNDVRLVSYKMTNATSPGDNYITCVYRIAVEGTSLDGVQNYSFSVIVKGLPPNLGRRKTFHSIQSFANEVAFYEKVMPKLMEFQKRKNVKNPFDEVPRCYKSLVDGENDYLVLEDLSPEGYQMSSRTKGLDFLHCSKVLQMFGRFHALSYALKDQEPDLYQELVKNSIKETYYLASNKSWYNNMLHRFCLIAMDAISKEYPNTIYEEKLKKFTEDNLYDHLVDLVQRSKEPFGAIGHGDAWACNFLYKYHEESGDGSPKPEKTKMIDFQLARFGSPVLDLSFFIYSCTDQELREAHYEELIKIYHDSLSNFLFEMGLSSEKLFPFKAFKEELAKYSIHGLGLAIESVPLSLLESNEAPNIELMEGEEEVPLEDIWNLHPIKDKAGRLRLCNVVKHAVDNNYL